MKNNKLRLLIVILVFFFSFFFVKYKDSFGIYRSELSSRIYLTVLDSNSTFEVTFDLNYGQNNTSTTYVGYNQQVGTLSKPTRTDYNFLGWYDGTGDDANRIYSDHIITGPVTFYAHWQKIICKKVTNVNELHTETCASGGCRQSSVNIPVNSTITYGTIYGPGSPVAGDAYNCDVNNDGTYNGTTQYGKYNERFYFIREIDNGNDENTAALVYYTSVDSSGPVDSQHNSSIGSSNYSDASAWLPTTSSTKTPNAVWNNPGLIDFDNGNGSVTRFPNFDDIIAIYGQTSGSESGAYFAEANKWFLFENSRFQSTALGRAGIWIEVHNNKYYRIHTQTVNLASPDSGSSSANTARPVIEIPLSAFEGFVNADRYTINFDTHGGTPQIESIRKYNGETMGTLQEPTLAHNDFAGWYAESTYNTLITSESIVTGDMTLHAKWTPRQTNTVTFDANGGTIENESTYVLTVDTGSTIDENDFPEAVYENHSFDGWYIDQELTELFDESEEITTNIILYAKWISANYVARVNGNGYESLTAAIAAVPTGRQASTTVTLLKNITLEETLLIPNNKWVEFDCGSYTISGALATLIANSGTLTIKNGTITTPVMTTTSTLITNASGAILNISGGTLTNPSNNGTLEFLILANSGGTIEITGGTFNTYGQSSAINNNSGILNISGGEIYAHNVSKGQAVYSSGGTVNISGNAYLENVSGTGDSRGAVDNNGGTINITGGTIVSKGYAAVSTRKDGGVTNIGTDDDTINISTPVMRGKTYGLWRNKGTVNVYDGIFESLNNTTAYSGTIADQPDGINFTNGSTVVEGVTYHTTYLLAPSITIYFYEESNGTPIPVVVDNGMAIGNDLPTPNPKQNYYFDGWYIEGNPLNEVTTETIVTGTFNAYAKWVQSVSNATMENPMNIEINTSDKIEFNENDIETVTYVSDSPSIASVSSDGTVHGIAIGTAIITMTGTKSGATKTVTINVTPVMRTITFTDSKHETFTREVADGSSLNGNMPSDPTDTNYVFDGWYIEDTMTQFTSQTKVTGDLTVVASWKEKINYATITGNTNPIELVVGDTRQVTIAETVQNDTVEDYTIASSNSGVATATKNGNTVTINAVAYGTTTITLTGSLSGEIIPLSVSVDYLKHTVTFINGETQTEVEVIDETAIGVSNMPANPTKTNYVFDGWFKEGENLQQVTAETIVTGDITAVAVWTPTIQLATIPNTFLVTIGSTNTIPVTNIPTGMESYTFTSSDSTIASVDSTTGVVSGHVLGTTNITVTGTRSNVTRTIEVTVSELTYTVTFMNDNSATPIDTVSVAAGNALGNNMPADLSETNYIFKGWTISGELTPFTSSTQVNADLTVVASWRLELNSATIEKNPNPLTFKKGKTGEITLIDATNGRSVEECTFASSNINIAEITYSNNIATVMGSDYGEITITITGTDTGVSKTVPVIINNINNITFDPDNGNSNDITIIQVADGGTIGNNVPSNPTYTGHIFDRWYLYDETNETLTDTPLDSEEVITSDKVFKARWAESDDVAAIGTTYYKTLQLAINAVPTTKVETEIRMLNNYSNPTTATTIESTQNVKLVGGNYTISNSSSTNKRLIFNKGTLTVVSGTITCGKSGLASIENGPGAKLYIQGGLIENTNDRSAIYNNGIVEISGGTLTSVAPERGVVQNSSNKNTKITMSGGTVNQLAESTMGALHNGFSGATIIVTGGTVTSVGNAIQCISGTNLVIGTDHPDNTYDATSPIIQGDEYGVSSEANYSVFDGIIKGKTNAVDNVSKITGIETGAAIVNGTDGDYKTLYYTVAQEKYRINFNAGEGTVSPSYLEYNVNSTIDGSNFPEPTRSGYTFGGWYTDSNFQTPFTTFTPNAADVVTYYAKWSSKYRINFNAGEGTVSPSYLEYNINSAIDGSNFPEPTRSGYTFGGWYTDSNFQTPFATFTPNASAEVTYYAKWTFNSSLTPVSHNILSNAMQDYFANVSSWVVADATDPSNSNGEASSSNGYDNGHHLFKDSISSVFTTNDCSSCQADNNCSNPQTNKTYCDYALGYDTGITDDLNVYLYENNQKGSLVTYTTSTGGVIYNMIPGVTYLWESSTDNTKYGVVTATGNRRTLKTSVRNLRDLGGLAASNSDVSGTIDYGRLYRGAYISSSQGVTDLNKLGITREVDLRGNGDGIQTYKLSNYDTGTSSSYTDIIITNYLVNPVITPYIPKDYINNYRAVKSAMRAIMEKVVFNHDSIFFHCTIGTDRTGTMAYFLEGLLGVSEEDRLRDYELTYFFGLTNRTRFHDSVSWSNTNPRFYSMYRSYPTNQDIYNYYTFESHVPDPNDPNDLTDDELLRRFRLELIH